VLSIRVLRFSGTGVKRRYRWESVHDRSR